MKKLCVLAACLFLMACSDDEERLSLTRDMRILTDAEDGFSDDSVIYLADSVKLVEELRQTVSFGQEGNPKLYYSAEAQTSAIRVSLSAYPDYAGGNIAVTCRPDGKTINFIEPTFPDTAYGGYVLKMLDSLKAGDSTYYKVLKFEVLENSDYRCNISAFYYGIHDGLIKIVSRNGVEMNRVPAKVYEDAVERRAKERALADSIAQAVADSIAQAVAESIIKANTPGADSSENASSDVQIEIPQEVLDLADSVANCIKRAYAAGSLTAIKDCEI